MINMSHCLIKGFPAVAKVEWWGGEGRTQLWRVTGWSDLNKHLS